MNKINHRITLDVQKGGIQKVLRGMFSGEVLSRRIVVSLVAGSSVCNMDINTTAIMYVTKPNGVTNYGACTVEDNLVFYDVLQEDVDAPGITQMQLKVLSGDMVLYAPVFSVEVQASRTSDTQASETPTYTALEQALAQATEVYNRRVVSIDVTEDLTFVVTYGDDTTYESDAIKNAIANIEDAEAERITAEHDRAEAFSKMEYAEQERETAEKERKTTFASMQNSLQDSLNATSRLQGEVQSMIDANGVTVDDKQNWNGKADGLSYVGSKLSLLNGEEVLESVEIIGGGGDVVIPDKVLTATDVTVTEAVTPVLNAELFGNRRPEEFALKEELTIYSLPRKSFSFLNEIETFLNNYSSGYADGIFYEFEVNGVAGYELGDGVWYISGTKFDSSHETQDAKRYCENGAEVKRRSKYKGVWSGWVADVNALDLANIINGTTQVGNAKTLDGHGAEYFLPRSGGTVNGNIEAVGNSGEQRAFIIDNDTRRAALVVRANGDISLMDTTNGKDILYSLVDGTTVFNGRATGNLPLDGTSQDTISRPVRTPIVVRSTHGSSTDTLIGFKKNDTWSGFLGIDGQTNPVFVNGGGTEKQTLLHTGNKPTGTYTGNGSATERTINTGGVGKCVLITSATGNTVFVTGGTPIGGDTTKYIGMSWSDCHFSNGVLTIATANSAINESGTTYGYQVL